MSATTNYSLKRRLTVPVIVAFVVAGILTFFLVQRQIAERLLVEFDSALLTRMQVLIALTSFEEADPEEGEDAPFVEFEFEPDLMPEFAAASGGAVVLDDDEDDEEDEEQHDQETGEADEDDEADEAELVAAPIAADTMEQIENLASGHAFFQLWLPDAVLARSPSLGDRQLPRPASARDAPQFMDAALPDGRQGRVVFRTFAPVLDEDWGDEPGADRLANLRERYPDLEYPTLLIAVAVDREPLDDTLAYVSWVLFAGLAVLMLVISALTWAAVASGLRPVHRLVSQLGTVNQDRLDSRLDERGLPEEVAPLATTMNQLLARLQKAFQKERLFSRNIAHELRTPIAELRSIGDVGVRWPDDPDTNRQFYQDIGNIGNRMDLIVTNLLTMARQENGQIQCAWERVQLAQALRMTAGRFTDDCRQRQIELALRTSDDLAVRADRVYLDIVATNLISNAISHGGRGQHAIETFTSQGRAGFVIENPALDLTEDDLPHLFDRFWRKDSARTVGQHVGLGLPLVKSLTEVLGWSLETELTPKRRFRVQIANIEMMH